MSKDNYIEAMKIVVDQNKQMVGVSAAPLALLMTQTRFLLAVDSSWISTILTLAVLSLSAALIMAWYTAQFSQALLAVEVYLKDGNQPEKGRNYLNYIQKLTKRDDMLYTEDNLIDLSKKVTHPTVYCLIVGYLATVVLIISLIWA